MRRQRSVVGLDVAIVDFVPHDGSTAQSPDLIGCYP